MGAYKYIRETMQQEFKNRDETFRTRMIKWRGEHTTERVENPTNLPRARSLGYKAVNGIFIIRVRVQKGMRKKRNPKAGRKARRNYRYVSTGASLQLIGEQRAARKHTNAEVLNSYWVGEDGTHKWFEVIMADRGSKSLDKSTRKMLFARGRAFRALTSSGKKIRGLRVRGADTRRTRSRKKEKKSMYVK